MHGLVLHGFRSDTIGHLVGFADAKDNYRHYRVHLHAEPSLPFLYPLVVDFRRGNTNALKSIFSFLLYDIRIYVQRDRGLLPSQG